MLDLAEKYKRNVDDVHQLFFQVSCDRDRLVKILEGGQKTGGGKWELLEDLAIKDDPRSDSYKYVAESKGEEEVRKRKRFLECTN